MRSTTRSTQFWVRPPAEMTSLSLALVSAHYRGPHASKRIAQHAGMPVRTAQKLFERLRGLGFDEMARMARHNEQLRADMIQALQGEAYAELVEPRVAVVGAAAARPRLPAAPAGGADAGPAAAPLAPAHALKARR